MPEIADVFGPGYAPSKREQILERIKTICEGAPGVVLVKRNTLNISETDRPAIVIYDADEDTDDTDPPDRPPHSPRRVDMTPEVYVLYGEKSETIGTWLNAYLQWLITAITTDATLIALVGKNGRILYDSSMTSLAPGRATDGNLGIGFTFRYILIP